MFPHQAKAHTHDDFPNDPSKWEPLFTEDCNTLKGGNTSQMYLAHTPPDSKSDSWHDLRAHLLATACGTRANAINFGEAHLGYTIGLFHDLGKAHPDFRSYLIACHHGNKAQKCPHAIWGAAWLYEILKNKCDYWSELVLPILCHHTGLQNPNLAEQKLIVHHREYKGTRTWKQIVEFGRTLASDIPAITPPTDPLRREMRIRMLFSCLIDSDHLDTEAHFEPSKANIRGNWTPLAAYWPIFRANHLRLMWASRGNEMSHYRARVYFEAKRSASRSPGIFRLTVPTGGGKTRAAMAFALKHAVLNKNHDFRRIITALPYTSIVDQTADTYRQIFGAPHVLEHHSLTTEPDETEHNPAAARAALATENWDAPIIVTTTLQLFESLFSNRPGRCRKIHRIANSILILDEVQTLPVHLLKPTLDVLKTLVEDYGVTLILCTATQPTFEKSYYLPEWKNQEPPEIVPSYPDLFYNLQRVTFEFVGTTSASDLACELASLQNRQSLAIFNTRKDALRVYEFLLSSKAEGLYHLSTLLCAHHRRAVLHKIVTRLAAGKPVRLISTQVVEAGVDLDFPAVYRQIAPLDRIVQAAGRCNREFRCGTKGGRTRIFQLKDGSAPKGAYATGLGIADQLLRKAGAQDQLSGTKIFLDYFQRLYTSVSLDQPRIQELRERMEYSQVAEKYRFIEPTIQVVVAGYDTETIDPLIKKHRFTPSRSTWRALQPFTVNLMHWEANKRLHGNELEIGKDLWRWDGPYDKKTHRGIGADYDPCDLITN